MKGITHEAIGFARQNWRGLLKVSIVPFLVYVLCSAIQLQILQGALQSLVSAAPAGNGQNIKIEPSMQVEVLSWITSLAGPVALLLAFVQIVRFRVLHETFVLTHGAGLASFSRTLLYGVGVALAGFAFYFLAGLIVLPFGLIGIGALAWLLVLVLTLWFMCRFLVGLPGVALGHRPQFFSDIWPLAARESWAVPLRILACFVVYNLAAVVLALPVALRVAKSLNLQGGAEPNELDMLKTLSALMDQIFPVMAGVWLLTLPLVWILSLILTHGFQRLLAVQGK